MSHLRRRPHLPHQAATPSCKAGHRRLRRALRGHPAAIRRTEQHSTLRLLPPAWFPRNLAAATTSWRAAPGLSNIPVVPTGRAGDRQERCVVLKPFTRVGSYLVCLGGLGGVGLRQSMRPSCTAMQRLAQEIREAYSGKMQAVWRRPAPTRPVTNGVRCRSQILCRRMGNRIQRLTLSWSAGFGSCLPPTLRAATRHSPRPAPGPAHPSPAHTRESPGSIRSPGPYYVNSGCCGCCCSAAAAAS